MKYKKESTFVIAILLVVLGSLGIKSLDKNRFQVQGEQLLTAPIQMFISAEALEMEDPEKLIVIRASSFLPENNPGFASIMIESKDLNQRKYQKMLSGAEIKKIIVADLLNESVQLWTFLRQKGMEQVYILTPDTELKPDLYSGDWRSNESLKYQFIPDTTVIH